ncbi:hypothetical protein [Runella slithyformis]|uniref:hypothetical protein n=1 Tax=Runella slithyformis TaxID=106 RepID=UPI00146CC351|nr:hypothetical protein [Runella slithyformis]
MTGKVLIQEGFSLARSDKDFLTIKTETQSIDGYSFKMFISVSINNKTIIIRGNSFNSGFEFGAYFEASKTKTVPGMAFNKMNEYALKLRELTGVSRIVYARE